jgi:hypothetical protein
MNRAIVNLFSASVAAIQASDSLATEVAQQAVSRGEEAKYNVQMVRMDIERLLMITEALWDMVKEHHNLTDEELIRRIQDIDMKDGMLDGKVAKQPPSLCPNCQRPVRRNRTVCIYCGTASTAEPFAR